MPTEPTQPIPFPGGLTTGPTGVSHCPPTGKSAPLLTGNWQSLKVPKATFLALLGIASIKPCKVRMIQSDGQMAKQCRSWAVKELRLQSF